MDISLSLLWVQVSQRLAPVAELGCGDFWECGGGFVDIM
jgi:hypothetical protein